MVTDRKQDSAKTPVKQGLEDTAPEPNKINASTPYDFSGKNLTPYGGLLPVITMLEKLGFQALVEETLTVEADSPGHGPVPVRVGHRAGPLHRLSAAEPIAFHRARPDPDGHPESRASCRCNPPSGDS